MSHASSGCQDPWGRFEAGVGEAIPISIHGSRYLIGSHRNIKSDREPKSLYPPLTHHIGVVVALQLSSRRLNPEVATIYSRNTFVYFLVVLYNGYAHSKDKVDRDYQAFTTGADSVDIQEGARSIITADGAVNRIGIVVANTSVRILQRRPTSIIGRM